MCEIFPPTIARSLSLLCVRGHIDFVFDRPAQTPDQSRSRWKRLAEILTVKPIVFGQIFRTINVAAQLHNVSKFKTRALQHGFEVVHRPAELTFKGVMNDLPGGINRSLAGHKYPIVHLQRRGEWKMACWHAFGRDHLHPGYVGMHLYLLRKGRREFLAGFSAFRYTERFVQDNEIRNSRQTAQLI